MVELQFLLLERSNSADICGMSRSFQSIDKSDGIVELMMRETKNDSPIREFEDQERESVQALVKRMIKEGAGPIKVFFYFVSGLGFKVNGFNVFNGIDPL